MIIIPPPKFRGTKRRRATGSLLTLVSAVYQDSPTQWITLSFDRPIDIRHIAGTQILVNDADINEVLMEANGSATLLDPMTVRIRLSVLGDSTGTGIQLNASTSNGIIAAGEDTPWAGADGVVLPFG